MRLPSGPVSMTPNSVALSLGTLIPATVSPAPPSMWASTICDASIRYTWSAPNTTTYSGSSSCSRLNDW